MPDIHIDQISYDRLLAVGQLMRKRFTHVKSENLLFELIIFDVVREVHQIYEDFNYSGIATLHQDSGGGTRTLLNAKGTIDGFAIDLISFAKSYWADCRVHGITTNILLTGAGFTSYYTYFSAIFGSDPEPEDHGAVLVTSPCGQQIFVDAYYPGLHGIAVDAYIKGRLATKSPRGILLDPYKSTTPARVLNAEEESQESSFVEFRRTRGRGKSYRFATRAHLRRDASCA